MNYLNYKLLYSARLGNLNEMERYLKEGADINATSIPENGFHTGEGYTSLLIATVFEHDDCLASLIQWGADINFQSMVNEEKNTALLIATRYGYLDCLRILLKLGANPDLIDAHSKTALQLSCKKSLVRDNDDEISHAMANVLLQYGANINSQDANGMTPLMIACEQVDPNLNIIKLLLENKADRFITNNKGATVFDFIDQTENELLVLVNSYQDCYQEAYFMEKQLSEDMSDEQQHSSSWL